MRGNLYRPGRRRAGSFVLALGATLAVALGWTSAAAARPANRHAPVKAMTVVHPSTRAHIPTQAHAAGHKIA